MHVGFQHCGPAFDEPNNSEVSARGQATTLRSVLGGCPASAERIFGKAAAKSSMRLLRAEAAGHRLVKQDVHRA